jgi:ribosomal protein S18 acetylase RimI-like enzyme
MTQSKLPTTPGFHTVDLHVHLEELFQMDREIFNQPPILLPFDKPEELLKFLTVEHKAVNVILNNNEGVSVGYISFEEIADIPNMSELVNIGVRSQFRGLGYGKKIIEYYLSSIKGVNSRLVTHPENKTAQLLYERYGYIPTKVIKNYFGDGEPRVLYVRPGNNT